MSVEVVNIRGKSREGVIYIGRPSPLGNPFIMRSEEDRHNVVEQYRNALYFRPDLLPEGALEAVQELCLRHHKGETLKLGCYCSPKECHGDILKEYIETSGPNGGR